MKQYLLFIILSIILVSCGGRSTSEKAVAGEAQSVKNAEQSTVNLTANTLSSKVNWKGFKPGGGHHGTVLLKEGHLNMKDGSITGGHFVIDMNSIANEDLDSANGQKLITHLKSADFFDVSTYPTSEFVITSALPKHGTTQEITGNLTMKGVTKSISFSTEVFVDGTTVTASTPAFTIDRTQWSVNYGSKNVFKNLADSFINDEMEIQIKLVTE